MKDRSHRVIPWVIVCLAGSALITPCRAQQMADSTFVAHVAHPAYTNKHPPLLFDEAHRNFHTTTGRYRPFADLARADGCAVIPNTRAFSDSSLHDAELLVIANAAGEGWDTDSTGGGPAFTAAEIEAVHGWVERGGALLLISDHAPFGTAAEALANRFGVDMSKGYTVDSLHADSVMRSPSIIVHSRANGLLADDPITRGRNAGERIERVIAFTGQSLKGPAGSRPLLPLSPGAVDLGYKTFSRPETRAQAIRDAKPAAGRVQGLAMNVGRGRLIVLGEAAMLSAQVSTRPGANGSAPIVLRAGMNREGIDNQQFALNLLHWLSGLLE